MMMMKVVKEIVELVVTDMAQGKAGLKISVAVCGYDVCVV